jgi:hypothetical protein
VTLVFCTTAIVSCGELEMNEVMASYADVR